MSKKLGKAGLGRTLVNAQKKKYQKIISMEEAKFSHLDFLHSDEGNKLKSHIDESPLEEFISKANLSSQTFEIEKERNFRIQMKNPEANIKIINRNINDLLMDQEEKQAKLIECKVPRRPNWINLTAEQLKQQENDNYLDWRRELAVNESNFLDISFTPYEKNIEVWRQLWRVLEKSDYIIQIVDTRDPLFYRSADLEKYVKELGIGKENILILNKADLLDDCTIKVWSTYFDSQGIKHLFFSAKNEGERIVIQDNGEGTEHLNIPNVYNREELLKFFENLRGNKKITIGMVGYPNVGKSSLINVIMNKKSVGVGVNPGKTKHFQTLNLAENITLCDCPGLVFPKMACSKADMVLNGVLVIDNLTDFITPMNLLYQRADKTIWKKCYGIAAEIDELDCMKLLTQIATKKGTYSGSGIPDANKTARNILKDFVRGNISLCKNPPGHDPLWCIKIITIEDRKIVKNQNFDETLIHNKEVKEDQNLENDFFEEFEAEEEFTEDDIFNLMDGKKVKGLKLDKGIRRDIKNAVKRGNDIDLEEIMKEIRNMKKGVKENDDKASRHKAVIKNF